MPYWQIKLYENRRERETIRGLSRGRMVGLMDVFDRLGVHAEATEYADGHKRTGEGESVNRPDPLAEIGIGNDEQAKRIGRLYGQALANFADLGTFQRALGNSMTGRHYEWDADELERMLTHFVDHGIDANPPEPHPRRRDA